MIEPLKNLGDADVTIRQMRIDLAPLNDLNIRQVVGLCLVLNDLKQRQLNVVGIDLERHAQMRRGAGGNVRGHDDGGDYRAVRPSGIPVSPYGRQ